MSDNPNAGYYQSGKGSLTGFDQIDIPTSSPDLYKIGWSVESIRNFLLNQSGANFISPEALELISQRIRAHLDDFDNPHRTTLDQIVGDFTKELLGAIMPGTVPQNPPFFAYKASLSLPLGDIVPVTYTSNNLYRRTAGGWFIEVDDEEDQFGTDHTTGKAGVPLYSSMINITPTTWHSDVSTRLNSTITQSTDETIQYPFSFYDVKETPVTGMFGIDIPMTQDLQVYYTAGFFVRPSSVGGSIKVYQPGDSANYAIIDLLTGDVDFTGDELSGACHKYNDGVLYVSLSFTSLLPTSDDKLRVVHINTGSSGDGTRTGSNGRHIFSVAHPQTTTGNINQPIMVDLDNTSSSPTFSLNTTRLQLPATLNRFIVSMTLDLWPKSPTATVVDSTILTFGNLVITRDQTTVRVSVSGNTLFTSTILEGLNKFTLSYSPTKIILKDLANDRATSVGTYPAISTQTLTFGPFGGYLRDFSLYGDDDNDQVVEYLNNG